jgi:hypothetical protein
MRHVIAYLLRDTVKRWLEQPLSPLSRLVVAFLVGGSALIVLGAFDAAERALVAKMRKLGVNTVIVSRSLQAGAQASGSRYEWLAGQGGLLVLARPYADGKSRAGQTVEICGYTPESLPALAGMLGDGAATDGALLLTESVPAGIAETVTLADGLSFDAMTVAPEGVLRLVPRHAAGGLLLVPVVSLEPLMAARGGQEVLVFERDETSSVPLATCVEAVRRLTAGDNPQARISSAMDLNRELGNIRETKRLWTFGLCALFGTTLVLVFGSMAGLEYRESRFLVALLRSMGARPWLLVARQVAESAVVANLGGVAAVGALALAARNAAHFAGLGMDVTQFGAVSPETALAVFGGLSAGAVAAAVPVMFALRKPIGTVLG